MEYTRPDQDDDQHDQDHEPREQQPLLANAPLPGAAAQPPPKSFQRRVEVLAIFFLVIVELGAYVHTPAVSQLLEGVICEGLHPEVRSRSGYGAGGGGGDGDGADDDDVCKSADVQERLARLLGWIAGLSCLPS
jgi:hypothetical protein